MLKAGWTLCLLLALVPRLRAEDGPSAPADGAADGVYYAPVDETPTVSGAASPGSGLSRAEIRAFAWGKTLTPLAGVDIYLGGDLAGRTPLRLDAALVPLDGVSVGARVAGYEEALRPKVRLPAAGPVLVALLPEDSASAITTPGWIVGLGLVAASLLAYRADAAGPSLALAAGGLLGVAATQAWAHWVRLPALRAQVERFNRRAEAAPAL